MNMCPRATKWLNGLLTSESWTVKVSRWVTENIDHTSIYNLRSALHKVLKSIIFLIEVKKDSMTCIRNGSNIKLLLNVIRLSWPLDLVLRAQGTIFVRDRSPIFIKASLWGSILLNKRCSGMVNWNVQIRNQQSRWQNEMIPNSTLIQHRWINEDKTVIETSQQMIHQLKHQLKRSRLVRAESFMFPKSSIVRKLILIFLWISAIMV